MWRRVGWYRRRWLRGHPVVHGVRSRSGHRAFRMHTWGLLLCVGRLRCYAAVSNDLGSRHFVWLEARWTRVRLACDTGPSGSCRWRGAAGRIRRRWYLSVCGWARRWRTGTGKRPRQRCVCGHVTRVRVHRVCDGFVWQGRRCVAGAPYARGWRGSRCYRKPHQCSARCSGHVSSRCGRHCQRGNLRRRSGPRRSRSSARHVRT